MRQVILTPVPEADGSYLEEPEWDVTVDSEKVCVVRSDEQDLRDNALNPLWKKLDVEILFDDDCLME